MANRNPLYANPSPNRQPGAKCSIILQKCLAIQLHKTGSIPYQPGPGGRSVDASDYWMYDNGYLLFQGFLEANSKCFWNLSLLEAVKELQFEGYVSQGILLVRGSPCALEVLRSAWSRNVLKAPTNYSITQIAATLDRYGVYSYDLSNQIIILRLNIPDGKYIIECAHAKGNYITKCKVLSTDDSKMNLEEGPFVFRVNDNGAGPNLLIQVCLERGWKEYIESPHIKDNWNLWWKTQAFPVSLHQKPLKPWQVCMERGWREYIETTTVRDNWNLWWKTSAFTVSQHKNLKAWQFTNHIPKGASICRKDNLARNLKCMRKVYGPVYDISPLGYNLPLEYTKLVADCSRNADEENPKVWICKPVGQSQGRGIFLFKSLSDLCYDSNAVVQRYIKNPLLIGGYKFDLRLYVCVPSYHPLTIYLYKEGLVRFSTDKFSLTDLNNPFCHLTNSSLNKLGPGYAEQKDRIGAGCKWNFKQLRHYFQQAGIKDWLLWQKISALVTLTVLSQSTSVPQTINCFEFYGFDVLVDDKLKPWLLEVNLSPALGNDCDVDPAVKKPLLHDLFDLLGLPVCNTGLSLFTIYSPNDTKPQSSSNDNSETEEGGYEVDTKQLFQNKSKTKILAISQNRNNTKSGNNKTTSTSALIVATAATKWRRKRKTNYLLGPPNKGTPEQKPDLTKRPVILMQELSNKNKSQIKSESAQKLEEQVSDLVKPKLNRKCFSTKKRDLTNKVKVSSSSNCITDRSKVKNDNSCMRANSCVDSSKTSKRSQVNTEIVENGSKSEKRIESAAGDAKPQKQKRTGAKSASDKVKKGEIVSTKNVLLPFDKSQGAYRGFRGKTRHPPPMLWGNGRDWRTPIQHEGDWGRIYPLNHSYNPKDVPEFEEDYMGNKFTVGDKQIRLVVHHVTKFIKISKQLYSSGLYTTEEELNAQLMKNLGFSGEVWLPSK